MFMLVSNISTTTRAFFRAIPYAGPQILLTGAHDYDVVSNSITLALTITDLTGTTTTNHLLDVAVNALPARHSRGPANTFSIDTRYAPSGPYQIVTFAYASTPVVFDTQNPPLDSQLGYDAHASLALDFENPAFLVNSGDLAGPEIGTNCIVFGFSQASQISANIKEPTTGRLVASYSGYMPTAGEVGLLWDFTEANGSPYTNDSYAISLTANAAPALASTNTISRDGVRNAAGVIIVYAEEIPKPLDPTDPATFLNSLSYEWIDQNLTYLYNSLYDAFGLTQYSWLDIGFGRDITRKFVINTNTVSTFRTSFAEALGSPLYSDLTLGPTHGSPPAFAANGVPGGSASSAHITNWITAAGANWRMRKVAMWSCRSGANGYSINWTGYPPFSVAFGIRPQAQQHSYQVSKNAGLFFKEELKQQWRCAQMEEEFDQLWITGPNGWPGACEPTWAIAWVLRQLLNQYPGLEEAKPFVEGFQWLIYTDLYDNDLRIGNWNMVHGMH